MPEARGKRGLYKADVNVVNVIAHHQHRPANPAQIFPARNARPSQQKYRRAQEQIVDEQPHPGRRPALHPRRIVIARARWKLALQHALQIAYCLHRGELGLAQIHLIAVFERAQQFHTIQRTQIQICFEIGRSDPALRRDFPLTRAINSANGLIRAGPALPSLPSAPARLAGRHWCAASGLRCAGNRLPATRTSFACADTRPEFVGASHHRLRISNALPQDHHRARLGVSISRQSDHHAIFHFGLPAQRSLKIFGINIHARRRDDHIFFAAFEIQIAFGVECADVAGAVPAFFAGIGCSFVAGPVSGGDAAAADQNFAIGSQFDLRGPPALSRSILCPGEKDDSR